MKKLGVFMADGCEEIEALTVVDLARRAGIEVAMISITGEKLVKGAHGINFQTDIPAEYMDFDMLDGIVLPGGMPGTLNLGANDYVQKIIAQFASEGKLVSAICAAPSVLGEAGLLKGKKATSYPGFEDKLIGAEICADAVVVDGNIITSRGMGTAIDFALAIIEYLVDKETADKLSAGIIYKA
ncbi:MAG: DJ-1/PfpI family protein [Agathobacter sp.]|nr:DJ-1/PfpI family protein [Agathobacter sp.]